MALMKKMVSSVSFVSGYVESKSTVLYAAMEGVMLLKYYSISTVI
jgi:hypothetical protein